jgi:hypothetical protein
MGRGIEAEDISGTSMQQAGQSLAVTDRAGFWLAANGAPQDLSAPFVE